MIYVTKQRIESGCKITVITINPEGTHYGSSAHYYEMIKQMENAGMQVIVKDEVDEHFAIIDDEEHQALPSRVFRWEYKV